MSKENEIWKDIVGYEGCYQVSNLGNVRSINGAIIRKDGLKSKRKRKPLKQRIRKCNQKHNTSMNLLSVRCLLAS